jgi:HlyD family secretion protein
LKTKWKITLGVVVVGMAGAGYAGYKQYQERGIVTVQTGRVGKLDLVSVVTASGEIKPRNYINIGSNANSAARISEILVKEGEHVVKDQLLAKLESIQPEADVDAQQASVASSQADSAASEAGLRAADESIKTLEASLDRAKSQLDQAKIDFDRTQKLFDEKLIARSEYDSRRLSLAGAEAAVREAETRIPQARAQRAQLAAGLSGSQKRVIMAQANLRRSQDVLKRTMAVSPIAGMVTNLPVRVGETVVPGIQNSSASLIMTIADMSLVTAEVKVDETDIVNVTLNQMAEITIDAIPNRTFKGKVMEIGNTAILRSTGQAASQSAISSQEAKDFKVVIALLDAPPEIRPGLSCTTKITTATRENVLTIPIQALTVRQKGDLEEVKEGETKPLLTPAEEKARKEELTGVFVIEGEKAVFRKVETGITGATDIEVVSGLKDGEQIITGSYKVIRTLRNQAKVKVDNKTATKSET